MQTIILGSGPQALFLLRVLSKSGVNVTLLALDKKVAFNSKYGEKIFLKTEKDFLDKVLSFKDKAKKLYICGGRELQFILEQLPNIFDIYDVYPKPLKAIRIFSDKLSTYNFLNNYQIKSPRSYSLSELINMGSFENKIIAKWNTEVLDSNLLTFKTRVFSRFIDFDKFIGAINPESAKYLVFQDFIEGGDENNISLQLGFSENELKVDLLTRKMRVSPNGFTSYIEEVSLGKDFSEQIFNPLKDAFKDLDYSGLAEVEFKYCQYEKTYYLIEVNPRPCGLVSALKGKYGSLNTFIYGGKSPVELNSRRLVRWSSILRDVQACIYILKEKKSLVFFIRNIMSIFTANTYDIFDVNDIKPFFSQFKRKKRS
ncbi:hypothetical protein PSEHALCIP103_03384 [Pseudoalteromonas haloplanktis]|uniref:ATP-grasp domain-containing protein n=1 Tax=Pseudoalteromonas haloplanktis TaxID=228 RepID=A0A9W4R4B6_PSEHA|nr:ATP-grasp domain-containing protein [Pseudoalteromonas haloplanktis]CAH9065463.1 hypothetical protein PSEHALCIP103_03384 [Pseudoalteromonas haloplanktis]